MAQHAVDSSGTVELQGSSRAFCKLLKGTLMRLMSVNVSMGREIDHMGRKARTGIFKESAKKQVMLRRLNLEGARKPFASRHYPLPGVASSRSDWRKLCPKLKSVEKTVRTRERRPR